MSHITCHMSKVTWHILFCLEFVDGGSVINGANPEFLNVTVARSCDRAKFSWPCAKSWDLYGKTQNVMHFNPFYIFFFLIHTYYVIFGLVFGLFLAQNFKTKVLTAQKNLLLKCLGLPCLNIGHPKLFNPNYQEPCNYREYTAVGEPQQGATLSHMPRWKYS